LDIRIKAIDVTVKEIDPTNTIRCLACNNVGVLNEYPRVNGKYVCSFCNKVNWIRAMTMGTQESPVDVYCEIVPDLWTITK
jgi:hypothetical protein